MGGIDKAKLHHWLTVVRRLKIWQLIVLLFLMTILTAYLLRQNNLGMDERRTAVKQADVKQEDVKKPLLELQHFVSNHMNTSMGENGIYLENAYNRDYAEAIQKASAATNPNSAVYQQASLDCRKYFVGGRESFRNDYVRCVIDRVGNLAGSQDPLAGLKPPNVDLYRFNFVSPFWSFDFAGISVLICAFLLLLIACRISFAVAVRLILKHRRK